MTFPPSNMQYKTTREEVELSEEPGTNSTEATVTAIMTTATSKVPLTSFGLLPSPVGGGQVVRAGDGNK